MPAVFPAATVLVFKGEATMLKTILVPLDGSLRAEYVLPIAARLARHTGGTLVLVRVVSFATDYWPAISAPYPSTMQAAVDGEMKEASTYLEKVASSAELAGLEATTTAKYGSAAPAILTTATEYHADMIVLCSHGYTGVVHVIMGSVAEKIARHSSIPVLIVREKAELPGIDSTQTSEPLRALVPLDGSSLAMVALEPAAMVLAGLAAPTQQTALHLVRVVKPAPNHKDELLIAQRGLTRARSYLSRTTELIREGYIAPTISQQQMPVSWSVALDADSARVIVGISENGEEDREGALAFGGCDLIAMATHGRGGLQRLAMGSVTEQVLHATRHPILIVRPLEVAYTQEPSLERLNLLS